MLQAKQTTSSAMYALIFVGSAFLFVLAKALLVPLAFALSLSLLLLPAVRWLEKLRLPHTLAVFVASGVAALVLFVGGVAIRDQVLETAQVLVERQDVIKQRIAAMHSPASETLNRLTAMLEDVSGEIVDGTPVPVRAQPVEVVQSRSAQVHALEGMVRTAIEPVTSAAIVLIFALYMLMNWRELRHRLLLLAGMGNISLMTRALDDAILRISEYLLLQLEVNAAYGVIFGIALFALGVPNAPLWGIIAGCLRIVPFVGTLIGMLLPLVLSLAVSPGWLAPAGVVLTFLILEFCAVNFIEPWLFSERTGISSLALLASAIFWSMLWGWPGLVLSTPLTVCLVVLGRHVPQFAFLHSLMGTKAALSPPEHMYERLLAKDQEEVWAVAERYLSGNTLVKLYDCVLLPVLKSLEHDRHRGTLDAAQERFFLLTLNELVARLATYRDVTDDERSSTELLLEKLNPQQNHDDGVALVCIPVDDKADELATSMLVQVLEGTGSRTITLRPRALTPDVLSALAGSPETVMFLSVMPPFAYAQTKLLCQKVRAGMPHNRIVIGYWHADEEPAELQDAFQGSGATLALPSFENTIRHSRGWRAREAS